MAAYFSTPNRRSLLSLRGRRPVHRGRPSKPQHPECEEQRDRNEGRDQERTETAQAISRKRKTCSHRGTRPVPQMLGRGSIPHAGSTEELIAGNWFTLQRHSCGTQYPRWNVGLHSRLSLHQKPFVVAQSSLGVSYEKSKAGNGIQARSQAENCREGPTGQTCYC